MIIPLYKPVGPTTHQLAQKLALLCGEKTTHTGSLDPLASGVVIGLTGPDRYQKEELNDVPKTYTWDIVIGVETDSFDLLGKVTLSQQSVDTSQYLLNEFAIWSESIKPSYHQVIPSFSAQRHKGTDFSRLSHLGLPVPKMHRLVNIYEISCQLTAPISGRELAQVALSEIAQVSGEFRQEECSALWINFMNFHANKQFSRISCRAVVGKKTYIRGLVRDFSLHLNTGCITLNLVRVQNGKYRIQECLCLI